MLKHIILSGDSAQHLMNVLARGSREDTDYVFSGVIRLWLDCISMQLWREKSSSAGTPDTLAGVVNPGLLGSLPPIPAEQIEQSLYDREKISLGRKIAGIDIALYNIIKFATRVAEQGTSVRLGMLDAGSLVLIFTAFAHAEFNMSSLMGVAREKGKGGKSDRTEFADDDDDLPHLSLNAIINEASILSGLIHTSKFVQPWRGERLDTRLSLCSSLVDSLLGKDEEVDPEHGVMHVIFRKIVN
jgi:hypothetical protein